MIDPNRSVTLDPDYVARLKRLPAASDSKLILGIKALAQAPDVVSSASKEITDEQLLQICANSVVIVRLLVLCHCEDNFLAVVVTGCFPSGCVAGFLSHVQAALGLGSGPCSVRAHSVHSV